MSGNRYKIEPIESAPFAQVAYVLWNAGSTDSLVVDPGFEPGPILDMLSREGLTPAAILNTHGHADHIAGNAALKKAFPEAPLIIGKNEAYLLTNAEANLSAPFGIAFTSPPADRLLAEGDRFDAAGFSFEIREIPGHSPGSIVFVCDQYDPPFVFVGDVIFAGSVGRTDLGGNTAQLLSGIKTKLFNLPDGTLLLPGHGPATTIGQERRTNPYVGEKAGLHEIG
jgi:hydroxyacylglutathione hydrolase